MMNPKALLALLVTMLIWGVSPVFIRTLSLNLGPGDHLVIRYAIASTLFVLGLVITGGWRIAPQDLPRLLTISIVGFVGYNLGSAYGFERLSAGVGSLVIGTQPLLIAILAAVIVGERLTIAAGVGLIVGLAGIIALFWNDLTAADPNASTLIGAILIFLSGLAWALYVVLSKPLIQKYGAYPITAFSVAIATIAMTAYFVSPATLTTLQAMTMESWIAMLFMAVISTLVAMVTWNYGASRVSAATSGAMLYLVPPLGLAAGALLLNEPLTLNALAGGALILLGVAIAQFGSKPPISPRPLLRTPIRPPKQKSTTLAFAAVLFAVTMWGLIPVAMRFLVLDLTPQSVMILRLVPAGLIALLVVTAMGVRRIEWRDWGRILIAALLGNAGYQILAAFGLETVPASWTGMLFGLEPVFIALFAVILAGDRLSGWLVGGIVLALAGTAALMFGSTSVAADEVSPFGLTLVALSTMGWAIYTVVIKPVAAKYGSFQTGCLAMGISAFPMFFFMTPDLPGIILNLTPVQIAVVIFTVIFGTFLAISAWNYALGHMESALAGMFLYVQPIVAAIGGILLLDERLSWPLVVGGALIILGVMTAQLGPRFSMGRLQDRDFPRRTRPVELRA
jgi:drug/metabolite transporter (DMT)-like permease